MAGIKFCYCDLIKSQFDVSVATSLWKLYLKTIKQVQRSVVMNGAQTVSTLLKTCSLFTVCGCVFASFHVGVFICVGMCFIKPALQSCCI